jgi:5,10-methylenetetrahydromethanopterin reductase
MKISAQFMPGDLPIFTESVRKAEEVGYSRAWLVDGQLLWRNVFVYMTHGLAATEHIPFGTAVTNPFTRHYTVVANAHATLAEIYPGRVILGMGRGDNSVRTLGRGPVSTNEFKEVIPKLRKLMAGDTADHDGTEIKILWVEGDVPEVPIMMPATGPKNLRLAGALADIVMIQVGLHPKAVKWAIDHIHAGAESAGRDPAEIQTTMYTAMWVSDDLNECRGMTRWLAACAANHIEQVARNVKDHGMPPEMARILDVPRGHYDYAGHLDPRVERSEYPNDIVDDFAFNGTPERILEMLHELAEVGLDEVAPAYLNGRYEQMDIVGSEIIPRLASVRT